MSTDILLLKYKQNILGIEHVTVLYPVRERADTEHSLSRNPANEPGSQMAECRLGMCRKPDFVRPASR